jgi:nucleoside-diphosphate-sugar epimerase
MHFLITGATGFVGSRLATALLERGDHVRGLVRDASRAEALRARGIEVVEGNMTDPATLQRAVQGIECVVHTAAVVGDWPDRAETRRVNVDGTRSLMLAARAAGVRRVVHFSSLAVYGNRHHHGTDESAPYRYGDTYTDAKIDSERVVLEFAARGDLEAISLRPGFVYGPGDRTLVPRLLDALNAGAFAFVGDGSKQMNCVYVDDVVQATLLASDCAAGSGAVYNITDGATPALRDFIAFIADYRKLPMPTRRVPPAVAVAGCYASEYVGHWLHVKRAPLMNISRLRFLYYNQHYSISRARQQLGYGPRFTYRDGLPPTLDWFSQSTA